MPRLPIAPVAASIDESRWSVEMDDDCVRSSYSHLATISLAAAVTALVVTFVLRGRLSDERLFGWLAVVCTGVAGRILLSRAFHARRRAHHEMRRWWWLFLIAMAIASAVFGSLVFLPESPDVLVIATMTLAIGGHIAGGAQSIVGTPTILLLSSAISTAPLMVVMFGSDVEGVRYLGVLTISFLVATAAIARQNYRALRASLALRYENLELAERLALRTQTATTAQEAAEHATRDKTRFLAAASHDLRQPLHAMSLFVDALDAQPQGEHGQHLLGRVRVSIDALQRLLDGLLDVSRLDAGVITPAPRVFTAAALAVRLESLFVEPARERGIGFRVVASPLSICADPDLVAQIAQNLVANAIRYTSSGRVLVCFRLRGNCVRVQVWDTGIGIPEDQHAAIFGEFMQLGNPERDRGKGVGLGLAIVERLARVLGTRVELRSRVGRGSVFWFDLPIGETEARKVEPADEPVAPVARSSTRGAKILVVDDDHLAREGLTAALESWGYRVVAARDVETAAALAATSSDLAAAIIDFRLPGNRTAVDLLAELAARGHELPAILVTGETDPARIRTAHATGLPVMFKPVAPATLRSKLERAVARSPRGA